MQARANGIGLANPNIGIQGNNIVVQLPGVKNPRTVLNEIGNTAQLFFRPVLCAADAYQRSSKSTTTTTTTVDHHDDRAEDDHDDRAEVDDDDDPALDDSSCRPRRVRVDHDTGSPTTDSAKKQSSQAAT